MKKFFHKILNQKTQPIEAQETGTNTPAETSSSHVDSDQAAEQDVAKPKVSPFTLLESKKDAVEKPPLSTHTTRHYVIGAARYKDEEQIGEGGTAFVYRSYDSNLRRPVAIKRFKETSDTDQMSDFVSEMEAVSRIQHRHVIRTYDAGVDSKGEYIVMEFIEGQELEEVINSKSLTSENFHELVLQTLEGLAATHEGGILHLDLKPTNIMVTGRRRGSFDITLIDYGKARIAKDVKAEGYIEPSKGLVGSIYYMSPEQLKKKGVSEKSDLYALGCVFYAALSGKLPFNGDSVVLVMSAHLRHDVIDLSELVPDLPKSLCDWVMKLIEKDPKKRPTSADHALELYLEQHNQS